MIQHSAPRTQAIDDWWDWRHRCDSCRTSARNPAMDICPEWHPGRLQCRATWCSGQAPKQQPIWPGASCWIVDLVEWGFLHLQSLLCRFPFIKIYNFSRNLLPVRKTLSNLNMLTCVLPGVASPQCVEINHIPRKTATLIRGGVHPCVLPRYYNAFKAKSSSRPRLLPT